MFVSICINTCDRPDYLWKLLVSISRQTHINFEVVIVDDGSESCLENARIKDIIDHIKIENEVKFHKNNGTMGLAASRNIAMDMADSDFIIKLDDDHYCDSACIEELCSAMDNHDDAGIIGMVFPMIRGDIEMTNRCPAIFGDPEVDANWVTQQELLYGHNVPEVVPAKTVRGLMMYRKDEEIRHDERLSAVAHGEDTIFSLEYLRKGYSNYVCTRAIAWHLYATSGGCRRWGLEEADRLRKKDAEIYHKYIRETSGENSGEG
jgi:GT2 family glycosyltransferase